MSKYYLYCVLDTFNPFNLPKKGLYDQEIKCIQVGDICILYSQIDDLAYENRLEDLKIHNSVAWKAMENGVVLPFEFGSIVKDEAAIIRLMDELYTQFKENFSRLTGKIEMGLKVFGDTTIDASNDASSSRFTFYPSNSYSQAQQNYQGINYLLNKYNVYKSENKKKQHLEQLVTEILYSMPALIVDSKVVQSETGKLLLNSSFLMSIEHIAIFKQRIKYIKENYPQYVFIVSGPWPPYNFINVKGEYANHESATEI